MKIIRYGIILILLGSFMVLSAKELTEWERLLNRSDLLCGYAEKNDGEELRTIAQKELARTIGDWWLSSVTDLSKVSYGNKLTYYQMVNIWLDNNQQLISSSDPAISSDKLVLYISKEKAEQLYADKYRQNLKRIEQGLEALELNKLGIFFRNFFGALVESDLLTGKQLILGEKVWDFEALTKQINTVAENLNIKNVGNTVINGNREITWQILYNQRPVNDLRIGIKTGETYLTYSVSDRYLHCRIPQGLLESDQNVTLYIDIQDRLTNIWDDQVENLSKATGMNGYEAFRTIPLREIEFEQSDWQEIRLPMIDDEIQADTLISNLRSLMKSMYTHEPAPRSIFSSNSTWLEYNTLQTKMNLELLDLETRVKHQVIGDGNIWRGFDVTINFADSLICSTNLVVRTDNQHQISGVWLGIKPIDYRLFTRRYSENSDQVRLIEIINEIERNYTRAMLGERLALENYPSYPYHGWQWVEIEDIEISLHQNGAVYNYTLTLVSAEGRWDFEIKEIQGE